MSRVLIAALGAIGGAAVGWLAFFWIAQQGFYGIVLPGALLGLGAGVVSTNAAWLPWLCGLAALVIGFLAEWCFSPFKDDSSLTFFIQNIHHLKPITLILIALGAVVGFWVPHRRLQKPPAKSDRHSAT